MLLPAAALLAAACGGEGPPPGLDGEPACDEIRLDAPRPRSNVVLLLNDTMRRDAAGIYGGEAATPSFDRFARESWIFEAAFAQAPWTKPSVATLFTSAYPSQHRVTSDPDLPGEPAPRSLHVLPEAWLTLAELLRDAGYRTGAFVANPWLDARLGFAQGFEHYRDDFVAGFGALPRGDEVVAAALAWLGGLPADRPWLLYVHLLDSHGPYGALPAGRADALRPRLNADARPVGGDAHRVFADMRLSDGTPLAEAGFRPTRALLREAYRIGIEDFDRWLGHLLDGLRARDDWRRTAALVTSDHGEAMHEHGYGLHGHGLHDEEAAIPLLARLPGSEPARGRARCLVGLVDVLPSLCAYLGLPCPDTAQGWSFVRVGDAPPATGRRFLVTEGVMQKPRHRAIRTHRFKLLYEPDGARGGGEPPYAFYDLARDPGERFDLRADAGLAPEAEPAFEALRARLDGAVGALPAPAPGRAPLDPELRRRLEGLGYLDE